MINDNFSFQRGSSIETICFIVLHQIGENVTQRTQMTVSLPQAKGPSQNALAAFIPFALGRRNLIGSNS